MALGLAGYGVVSAVFLPLLLVRDGAHHLATALTLEAALTPVQILCGGFATYYAPRLMAAGRGEDAGALYSAGALAAAATVPLVFVILIAIYPLSIAAAGSANAAALAINGAWRLRASENRWGYALLVLSQSTVSAGVLLFCLIEKCGSSVYLIAQPSGALFGSMVLYVAQRKSVGFPGWHLLRESSGFAVPEILQWTFWSLPVVIVGTFGSAALLGGFVACYKLYFLAMGMPAIINQLVAQAMSHRVWRDRTLVAAGAITAAIAVGLGIAIITVLPLPSVYGSHRSWLLLMLVSVGIYTGGQPWRLILARDRAPTFIRIASGAAAAGCLIELLGGLSGQVWVILLVVSVTELLYVVVLWACVRRHVS